MLSCIRLPLRFDPGRLQADVDALPNPLLEQLAITVT